jgi:hypothetical protein
MYMGCIQYISGPKVENSLFSISDTGESGNGKIKVIPHKWNRLIGINKGRKRKKEL